MISASEPRAAWKGKKREKGHVKAACCRQFREVRPCQMIQVTVWPVKKIRMTSIEVFVLGYTHQGDLKTENYGMLETPNCDSSCRKMTKVLQKSWFMIAKGMIFSSIVVSNAKFRIRTCMRHMFKTRKKVQVSPSKGYSLEHPGTARSTPLQLYLFTYSHGVRLSLDRQNLHTCADFSFIVFHLPLHALILCTLVVEGWNTVDEEGRK